VDLRRIGQNIFWAGVVLAVALTGTLREARADKKTTPAPATNAAPAKAAPAPARAVPAPAGRVQPAAGGAARPGGVAPAGGVGNAGRGGGGLSGGGGNNGHGGLAGRSGDTRGGSAGRGPTVYAPRPGDQTKVLPDGRREIHSANGQTVRTDPSGKVRTIEASRGLAGGKMVVNRGPGGARMVETGRPGARVVSYGPRRGFVERTVRPGYISRTYVVGGRSYAHVYREFRYRGFGYYRYVPAFYYGPRFYAWAITPWGVPMPYGWGSAFVAPWLYTGYFTPYGTYASPDLWLTDYLLAENLRLAYESQQAGDDGQAPALASGAQSASATLSPEMKAMVAEEVGQQLAAEKAAAANPGQPAASAAEQAPAALDPAVRVFVVSSALDVTADGSQQCSLTAGDIVTRIDNTPDANQNVSALVTASKKTDCPTGQRVGVSVQALQEMHNQFREQIDSGLKMMADNQAKGLPNVSAAGARPVAEGTADPAPDAQAQLAAQETDAATLEAQVRQSGGGD